eukprot:3061952-Rhodomonas_salina.1
MCTEFRASLKTYAKCGVRAKKSGVQNLGARLKPVDEEPLSALLADLDGVAAGGEVGAPVPESVESVRAWRVRGGGHVESVRKSVRTAGFRDREKRDTCGLRMWRIQGGELLRLPSPSLTANTQQIPTANIPTANTDSTDSKYAREHEREEQQRAAASATHAWEAAGACKGEGRTVRCAAVRTWCRDPRPTARYPPSGHSARTCPCSSLLVQPARLRQYRTFP